MELDDRTRIPARYIALRSGPRRTAMRPGPRAWPLTEAWLALLLVAASGCSSVPEGTPGSGTGGDRSATGGSPAAGNGGTPGSGGAPSTGGATTGGATGAGTGGTNSTGGVAASGGVFGTGGTSAGGAGSGGAAGTASGLGGSGGTAGNVAGLGGSAGRSGGAGGTGAGAAGASSGSNAGGSSSGAGGAGAGGKGGSGGAAGSGGATGYNPCPTTSGTACTVLPLGDSITEGCCTAPMGGYRIELYRQAVTNRKGLTFVGSLSNGPTMVGTATFPKKHEGHGGWTISQIDGVVPSPAFSTIPHIVLLMIGTNDINGNNDLNNAPTRLGTLIDGITTAAPSALVVVSAIIPTTTDGTNQRVQTYNTSMRGLVTTRAAAGKHVVFLDNYATFSQTANYKTALMADNLHPNDAGYVALGRAFYGVIEALLPPSP